MDVCLLTVKNRKVYILAQVKGRVCFRDREVTPRTKGRMYTIESPEGLEPGTEMLPGTESLSGDIGSFIYVLPASCLILALEANFL